MRRRFSLCLILFLLCASAFCEERVPSNYTSKKKTTIEFFGTASVLCLYDDYSDEAAVDHYLEVWDKVKQTLRTLDNALSVSLPESEIARFNRLESGQSMPVSVVTAEVFELAMECRRRTDGRFNPAVFPLVDLWGFSPRFIASHDVVEPYDRVWGEDGPGKPDDAYIEAFRSLADPENIVLSGNAEDGFTLAKNVPSVTVDGVTYQAKIDLGGIAKGYAVDLIGKMLRSEGYAYGYFSCGSSSMCLLRSASHASIEENDPYFSLNIRSPRVSQGSPEAYAAVRVKDLSLSSSGDYDNNYMFDGNICCHIIDPETGYPLNVRKDTVQQGVSTVTLLSGSAVEDDALTTSLCLLGPGGAIDYINENLSDRQVVMVFYRADSKVFEVVTNIPEECLRIDDKAYVIASRVDENGKIRYCGELFSELAE